MSACPHQWQQVYEESLIGGALPVGWQCKLCSEWVDQNKLTTSGMPGTDTGEKVLIGPHGCKSLTSSGQPYSKQIQYPDGRLEIIP